jgi:hypothetical protein
MHTIPVIVKRLLIAALVGFGLAAFQSTAGAQSFAPSRSRQDPVPQRYRPPAGMCRIWLDSVPANRQPAPTDCASAIRNLPPNARVIFSDSAASNRRDKGKPKKPDPSGDR